MCRSLSFLLLLLIAAPSAMACSFLPGPPEEKFAQSQELFLARPASIERTPLPEGEGHWPDDHQQHVVWEVVKVWKGSIAVGERFERTNTISRYLPCSGHNLAQESQPVIFASPGDYPPMPYYAIPTDYAGGVFDALHKRAEIPHNR